MFKHRSCSGVSSCSTGPAGLDDAISEDVIPSEWYPNPVKHDRRIRDSRSADILFKAQSVYGIDTRSPARGNVAGQEHDDEQAQSGSGDRAGIRRAHSEEHACDGLVERDGTENADGSAEKGKASGVSNHHAEDTGRVCPESHADPELLGSLRHGKRNNPVDADGG